MTTLAHCPEHSRPTGLADCAACMTDDERERSAAALRRIADRTAACLRANAADALLCTDDETEGGAEYERVADVVVQLMETAVDLARQQAWLTGERVSVTGLARGDGR